MNEDLWLILIWPVAVHHRWTYKDVVRAVRLHFGHDHLGRSAPKITSREALKVLENRCERNSPPSFWKPDWMTEETAKAIQGFCEWRRPIEPVKEYVPNAEVEWRAETLKVNDADAEAMRLRCKRLELARLNPGCRDMISEPRFFSLVNALHATE